MNVPFATTEFKPESASSLIDQAKAKGYTQPDLAKCIGVTVNTISNWKRHGFPDCGYCYQFTLEALVSIKR